MLLAAAALPLVASADTTQYWYLSSDGARYGDYVMYKGSQSGSTDDVTLVAGTTRCWIADNPAAHDITFGEGDWTGRLRKSLSLALVVTYTVSIGYWDVSGDNFVSEGSDTGSFAFLDTTSNFTIADVPSFTVKQGDYLALQVENTMELTDITLVTEDDDNYVTYPEDQPTYPVPELPTIVLLATGLVFLAGYLGLKKPKRVYLKA